MSARLSTIFPRTCSGLIYAAVPRMTPILVMAGLVIVGNCDKWAATEPGSRAFANPKSSTFTLPSGVILMLAGFKSRIRHLFRGPLRVLHRCAWQYRELLQPESHHVQCAPRVSRLPPVRARGSAPNRLPGRRISLRCSDDSARRELRLLAEIGRPDRRLARTHRA